MTKARTLADFISDGSTFADGAISVAEVSGAAPTASPTFTGSITGASTLTLRNDTGTDADEPKLTFDNDTFAGANHANIQTGNGGLLLKIESPSTSTFQNRHKLVLNGGASDDFQYNLSTDNGSNYVNYFKIDGGNVIFNETGADKDFRVESDNNTHALFVDAGNNCIGIKQSNPSGYNAAARDLVVGDGSSTGGITIAGGTGSNGNIFFADGGGSDGYRGFVQYRHSVDDLILGAVTETMLNLASAEVVFNDDSYDRDFRVESNNSTHMLYVDGGLDRIGVNNATPSSTVHIGRSGLSDTGLTIQSATTSDLITLNGRMNNSGSTTTAIHFKDGSTATSEGSITVTSSGVTYNTTSDLRLKTDIQPISDGTEKLMAMNPVIHKWKADPHTGDTVHGFIAQEMQNIVPEAVSGEPDGEEMMSMDYGRITPVLVAALQDAHKKIEAMEKRLTEMEIK